MSNAYAAVIEPATRKCMNDPCTRGQSNGCMTLRFHTSITSPQALYSQDIVRPSVAGLPETNLGPRAACKHWQESA